MKTINKVCQILGLLTGIAAVVMFFTNFATIVSADSTVTATGAQLAFGSSVNGVALYKSYKLLFCFLVAVLSVVLSGFSFKSKGAKYATPVSAVIVAVFMLVVTLGNPYSFVNADSIKNVTGITYTAVGLITTTALLFGCTVFSAAHLFINDYIECAGKKPTIMKRVIKFFRDYKSEVKKIVWPSFKDVVKNTVIVLIMCAVVGAFIWVLDFGLSKLLSLIWSLK